MRPVNSARFVTNGADTSFMLFPHSWVDFGNALYPGGGKIKDLVFEIPGTATQCRFEFHHMIDASGKPIKRVTFGAGGSGTRGNYNGQIDNATPGNVGLGAHSLVHEADFTAGTTGSVQLRDLMLDLPIGMAIYANMAPIGVFVISCSFFSGIAGKHRFKRFSGVYLPESSL